MRGGTKSGVIASEIENQTLGEGSTMNRSFVLG